MDIFLNTFFSAPTVYFSIPFIFLMFFWVLTVAGLADFEMLDFLVDVDSDLDADSSQTSWLEKLGLGGIPLTVVITLIDIYALALTYMARKYIMPLFDSILSATAIGLLVAVFAIIIALPIAALSSKPLRRFFYTHQGISKTDLVGTICTVTTQAVNESFGQARTDDGMTLSVRANLPNNIGKGTRIALIEFNSDSDTYSVVTETELMAMSSSTI
jgi:hypothetical protein